LSVVAHRSKCECGRVLFLVLLAHEYICIFDGQLHFLLHFLLCVSILDDFLGVIKILFDFVFSFHVCLAVLFKWLDLLLNGDVDVNSQDFLTVLAEFVDPLLDPEFNISFNP